MLDGATLRGGLIVTAVYDRRSFFMEKPALIERHYKSRYSHRHVPRGYRSGRAPGRTPSGPSAHSCRLAQSAGEFLIQSLSVCPPVGKIVKEGPLLVRHRSHAYLFPYWFRRGPGGGRASIVRTSCAYSGPAGPIDCGPRRQPWGRRCC